MVHIVRNGFVESVHHARVVITDASGSTSQGWGEVDEPMFPRSSSKPLQAIGMLRAGLDLDGELLALAAASHSGESFHVDGVRRILTGCGLTTDDLDCPADYPLDEAARIEWIRSGHGKEPVAMNCSGKHAAMLRTAVRNDWPTTGYRDLTHPVQQAIRVALDDLAGEASGHPAIDGCGAPLLSVSLAGLARSFGRIAAATDGPERRLAEAYRAFPAWASGTTRDEVELHRAIDGLIAKAGAEGVYAVGLPDGRGVALKISDGSARPRSALMAAVLQHLGYAGETLDRHAHEAVLGHGEPVGRITVVGL